jgi:hypothetical protein
MTAPKSKPKKRVLSLMTVDVRGRLALDQQALLSLGVMQRQLDAAKRLKKALDLKRKTSARAEK